jgi:hypothetical protein
MCIQHKLTTWILRLMVRGFNVVFNLKKITHLKSKCAYIYTHTQSAGVIWTTSPQYWSMFWRGFKNDEHIE